MNPPALARAAVALLSGALFGFGLSLSGMVDPARVLGFLDIASGRWDPGLIFVLGGAVTVAILGVLIQRALPKPVLDDRFHLPARNDIDRRLVIGSVLFGVGWGLAGFCPGPAISALATGIGPVLIFVAAMVCGMVLHDRLLAKAARDHRVRLPRRDAFTDCAARGSPGNTSPSSASGCAARPCRLSVSQSRSR